MLSLNMFSNKRIYRIVTKIMHDTKGNSEVKRLFLFPVNVCHAVVVTCPHGNYLGGGGGGRGGRKLWGEKRKENN
jgi:hypothetical protein